MNLKFYDVKGNIVEFKSKNEILFRPGIYVVILNKNNEILMIIDEKTNKWEFPGGGLEIGESFEEAAIREVKEETGYDIKIISELPFYIRKQMRYFQKQDKFYHCISFFYVAKLKNKIQGKQNFAEDENILDVRFFNIEELKTLDLVWFQKEAMKKFLKLNL